MKIAETLVDSAVDIVEAPVKIAESVWTGSKDLFTGDFKGFGEALLDGVEQSFVPMLGPMAGVMDELESV